MNQFEFHQHITHTHMNTPFHSNFSPTFKSSIHRDNQRVHTQHQITSESKGAAAAVVSGRPHTAGDCRSTGPGRSGRVLRRLVGCSARRRRGGRPAGWPGPPGAHGANAEAMKHDQVARGTATGLGKARNGGDSAGGGQQSTGRRRARSLRALGFFLFGGKR
uniref:Uncharacterized protein n=1 Tax=Aegilops tauschii subsp. strangulata TaxID=200361 RepID=A0A453LXE4_AEGTS